MNLMKSKKFIAGVTALTIVTTSAAIAMMANAADGTVDITVASQNVQVGDAVQIDVSLANVPTSGLSVIEFGIDYDDTFLTVTDVTLGEIGDTGAAGTEGSDLADTVFTWNDVDGQLCIMWVTGLSDTANWIDTDGVLVTISGTVSVDAQEGDTCPLELVPITRPVTVGSSTNNQNILLGALNSDSTTATYDANTTDGLLQVVTLTAVTTTTTETESTTTTTTTTGGEISASMYGDVNVDTTVTVSDIILLARYLAEDTTVEITEQGLANAECTGDGYVNSSDLAMIANCVAHIITEADLNPNA